MNSNTIYRTRRSSLFSAANISNRRQAGVTLCNRMLSLELEMFQSQAQSRRWAHSSSCAFFSDLAYSRHIIISSWCRHARKPQATSPAMQHFLSKANSGIKPR